MVKLQRKNFTRSYFELNRKKPLTTVYSTIQRREFFNLTLFLESNLEVFFIPSAQLLAKEAIVSFSMKRDNMERGARITKNGSTKRTNFHSRRMQRMSKMWMVDTCVSRAKEYLFARRSRYYLREMRIKNSGQTRAKKNGTTAQVSTSLYSSSLCYLHSRG